MLDSCQNAQERWGGVHRLIDRWLKEREELVQAFRALRDAKPAFADKEQNRDFCAVLVLSLIHISEPTRPRFGSRMPSYG